MRSNIKEKIKSNARLKQFVLALIVHPVKTRPRWWIRLLQFIYMKRGRKSVIYKNVRKDIVPFNSFILGEKSIIESFSTINNMVGDITIGSQCRIVTQSVPPNSVVAGNPGKVIKQYNPQTKEWENIHHKITDK